MKKLSEEKEFARKIVMKASQTALAIFREENPLPEEPSMEYFQRQIEFINGYVFANVSEETRKAAI